ncbi:hypothetical protein E4U14_001065 [Claviceps sp. LM454 group G7]|nr:hypothetical protein E4U14_001065 [Claviceps sp. LM454 group G7]
MKKWMTKLDIEDDWHLMDGPGQDEGLSPFEDELTKFSDQYQRISRAMLTPLSKGTLTSEATVEFGDHFRNIQLPPR